MKTAVIAAYGRSPIAKAVKGRLKFTGVLDYSSQVLEQILKDSKIDPALAEDLICGCSIPEAEQGLNIARILALSSGFPQTTAGQTVNRFCSSGLQAVATASNAIMAGQAKCIVAGGVENMSKLQMLKLPAMPEAKSYNSDPNIFMSMGLTAENVAAKYGISRERMDAYSYESHVKAVSAVKAGKFKEEIKPILCNQPVVNTDGSRGGKRVLFESDESPREDISLEDLAKLKPVFKLGGCVTAGNSSPMNDGAAFTVIMEEETARANGIKPLAKFLGFAVAGVDPAHMGIGPVYAVPKALKAAGLSLDEIDLIELNEAFASQTLACIDELGLDIKKVNVNGGAIAFGHPLGCTGAYLTMKLICELKRRDKKYGMVTMCVGGGMGAAGIFEVL